MSQDIVADTLNQIMNAKRAKKGSLQVKKHSKFLLAVLAIGKLKGYIKSYKTEGRNLDIEVGELLNACKAVKPRFVARTDEIMKYVRRYLPARNMGIVIVSTSKGLMTHHTAIENKIGGSIIAYFY
jgi:small subunit ribosomal protein S8